MWHVSHFHAVNRYFPYKVSYLAQCNEHSPLCEHKPVHINFTEGHTVAFRSSCVYVGGNIILPVLLGSLFVFAPR